MAVFNATHFIEYNIGNGSFHSLGGFNAVVTDGEADTTFEDGDSFTAFSQIYTYAGQVEVDGTFYPALYLHGNALSNPIQAVRVLMDTAPQMPPGSLSLVSGPITVCFAAGSLIATPGGEVAVEDLQIGDLIRTADGRDVAVTWLGRQRVSTRFGPTDRLRMVRFATGSLGHGLPHSDLTVTADHAMLVGGVLCNASALINGDTITQVPVAELGETFTVYHVETNAHEIIRANGARTETFIDNVSRRAFDNYAEYAALYGDEREMQELPLPRATSARQLPAGIRALLSGRAVA